MYHVEGTPVESSATCCNVRMSGTVPYLWYTPRFSHQNDGASSVDDVAGNTIVNRATRGNEASRASTSVMDTTLDPSVCEERVASPADGDETSRCEERRSTENAATTNTLADDEEPQLLDVGEETEPESDGEVELVLVDGELVQLQPSRPAGGDAQVVETSTAHSRDPDPEQDQDQDQEPNVFDVDTSEHAKRIAITHAPRMTAPSKGAQYGSVELPGDEVLLRALVARVPQFADSATPNRFVWHDVAAACGGRFDSGIAVQLRVRWLQGVSLDPSHHMHPHLTDELRNLITQYRDARANQQALPLQPASLDQKRPLVDDSMQQESTKRLCLSRLPQPQEQHRDADHASAQDGVHDGHAAQKSTFPRLLKTTGRILVDSALEEKVMPIVLKHAPLFATAERKMDVWDAIASDSRGRYKNARSANTRMRWLCNVVQNATHQEHANMSPRLREMLHQFLAFGPWDKHSVPSRSRNDTDASEDASDSAETPPPSPSPTQQVKRRTTNPWRMVHAPMDELLIQLVLEKRLYSVGPKERTVRWAEIAQTLQSPCIQNGTGGQARVRWLVHVMKYDTHSEHDRITPKLRRLLTEFLEANSSPTTDSAKNDNVGSRRVRKDGQDESKEEEASGDSDDEEDGDDDAKDDVEEVAKDEALDEAAEATIRTAPTTHENEVLLRAILRVRPFHASGGRRTSLWRHVVASVQRELGSKTVFLTSRSCLSQMKRLLCVARYPKGRTRAFRVTIPRYQLEMLTLIDTLIKTKWPLRESHLAKRHRTLLDTVAELLEKTPEDGDRKTPDDGDDPDDDYQEEKRRPRRGGGSGGGDDVDDEEQRPSEMSPRRVRVGRLPRLPVETPRPPPLCKLVPTERRLTGSDEDTIETELDDLRASLAIQVTTLQSEVATCRAQLTLQSSTVEHERQEHRAELRAMMELLVSERETHKREKEAVLAVLKREQSDRKDEFVTMMNLVTRSMAFAAPQAPLSPDAST